MPSEMGLYNDLWGENKEIDFSQVSVLVQVESRPRMRDTNVLVLARNEL